MQKATTINTQGNTVVTERTFANGRLVKEEVTVTNPAGQLVSKTETLFNGAGQVAKREVVTVNAGNVTQTERKFANGVLVKEEVTVTNAAGQLVSKTETVFNAAGQVAKRETVMVMGGVITELEQRFVNGQLVKQEITTTTVNNGRRVKVEREFQLVNGVLKEIKEERKVEKVEKKIEKVEQERKVEKVEDHNRDAKGAAAGKQGKDKNEQEAKGAAKEHQEAAEHSDGDRSGDHGSGDHESGGHGGKGR